MAQPKRNVVLCADDFGLSEGVSQGILELAHMGRISATSAMTNCPWWPRMAAELNRLEGRIAVGLHLTLTTGRPLGAMPRFAPEGRFPENPSVVARALEGRLPLEEIRAEIDRQLAAFVAALGRAPDFVDGHQHVHVLPGIRNALLAALKARELGGLWLRNPADRIPAIVRRPSAGKALTVRLLSLGFPKKARRHGFATNEGFSGFSPFSADMDIPALFEAAFAHLGPRPVVMCHPGHADRELAGLDDVIETRPRELAYLRSDAFAQLLAQRGLALARRPL